MAKQHFLAGVGRALLLRGNDLIGVARTLQESSLNFNIESEEVRGGLGNALFGKYFHDSSLEVTLVDCMFSLQYMGLALGVDVQSGGISVKEEQVIANNNTVTLTEIPLEFNGTKIGWYSTPGDAEWHVGTFEGRTMTISGIENDKPVCVKYFYNNANAESVKINSQYIPAELHVVIINDLFSGDVNDITSAERYGRLITDIPRLQMSGAQELTLNATSAATISLTGSALGVMEGTSCEEMPVYGTMTQEIYGDVWQDKVVALAVENVEITAANTTLHVRAVFGGGVASKRVPNDALTFTPEPSTITVSADGVVAGTGDGTIKIQLKKASGNGVVDGLEAYASVNISA